MIASPESLVSVKSGAVSPASIIGPPSVVQSASFASPDSATTPSPAGERHGGAVVGLELELRGRGALITPPTEPLSLGLRALDRGRSRRPAVFRPLQNARTTVVARRRCCRSGCAVSTHCASASGRTSGSRPAASRSRWLLQQLVKLRRRGGEGDVLMQPTRHRPAPSLLASSIVTTTAASDCMRARLHRRALPNHVRWHRRRALLASSRPAEPTTSRASFHARRFDHVNLTR